MSSTAMSSPRLSAAVRAAAIASCRLRSRRASRSGSVSAMGQNLWRSFNDNCTSNLGFYSTPLVATSGPTYDGRPSISAEKRVTKGSHHMGDWIEPGERAPGFTLTADDGSKVRLSDLKGKPVVVYFYPR